MEEKLEFVSILKYFLFRIPLEKIDKFVNMNIYIIYTSKIFPRPTGLKLRPTHRKKLAS